MLNYKRFTFNSRHSVFYCISKYYLHGPAHIRDHDADARCGSLYRIEAAWSYLRENDTGVRQNHQPEKRRSSQFGQRAIRLM